MSRIRSVGSWLGLSERRWTKAPNEEVRPGKTVWDWLELFIVPAVLVAIGYALNSSQASRDRVREDKRASAAQRIADAQRQDELLQDYLTRIDDLVLTWKLRESKQESDVREVARTLTLTVLRRLDGQRKGEVVRFLADAHLIDGSPPVVRLERASLQHADLTGS
jgi:hypothetical protein